MTYLGDPAKDALMLQEKLAKNNTFKAQYVSAINTNNSNVSYTSNSGQNASYDASELNLNGDHTTSSNYLYIDTNGYPNWHEIPATTDHWHVDPNIHIEPWTDPNVQTLPWTDGTVTYPAQPTITDLIEEIRQLKELIIRMTKEKNPINIIDESI